MRSCVRVVTFLVGAALVLTETVRPAHAQAPSLGALAAAAEARSSRPTEQQWIVADVIARVASIAATDDAVVPLARVQQAPNGLAKATFTVTLPSGEPMRVEVVDHLWAPGTYAAVAARLLGTQATSAPRADADVNARAALVDLTADTLLAENERISTLLDQNLRNTDAHEAAALLIGAFALREPWWLGDVRPSLSRMTAHLAVAQVLRAGRPESRDGMLARAILSVLVGLQRDALATVTAFQQQAASDADRRWVRALRLRITGDWRGTPPSPSDSALERFEHGRAVRERLGIDALLNYLDTLPDVSTGGWHRVAYTNDGWNIEAGNRFAPVALVYEVAELGRIWTRLHAGRPLDQFEIADLNARPASTLKAAGKVQILDWGSWAAHQQRHLAMALIAVASQGVALGRGESELLETFENGFSSLWVYPVVLRWMAQGSEDYEHALRLARPVVEQTPELIVPAAWTFLLEKPAFAARPMPLPLDTPWFTPAVPAGTALQLGWRSLRAATTRPATRAEVTRWAQDMPYDHYTLWSKEWLVVDGAPTLDAVRKAMAPLASYDTNAIFKIIMYMPLTDADRIEFSQALCALSVGQCNLLGEALLMVNREKEAAATYDKWETGSRDRVAVSREVTWLIRYHQARGDAARAEAIARGAADTGSGRGLQELGEWLDRAGRYAEAEQVYRRIVDRYEDTVPLGTFLMRESKRRSDPALQEEASEMLREIYPSGVEPLVRHNLEAVAATGVTFHTFGPRAAAAGLQKTDVIVGVDGWRVRNTSQYLAATRFSNDDVMKLLVWRAGRYQDLTLRVPERSMGTRFKDHRIP